MLIEVLRFVGSLVSRRIKCIFLYNRPCRRRPKTEQRPEMDINSYEPLYYSFTVSVNKCIGSCNTIHDP